MELEIKCHNCGKLHFSKLDFDIWVEDEDIEDEILVFCKRCKRPNQVNYIIENGSLISLDVIDGEHLIKSKSNEDSDFKEYLMEKRKEEEENEKRRLLNQTKWIFMEYIEIKDAMKSILKYWKKHPSLNRKDERMRNYIKNEWKYIKGQAVYLKDVYDGDYESNLQDKLDHRIDSLKTDYLKYYNFDGSLDLKVFNRDKPAQ